MSAPQSFGHFEGDASTRWLRGDDRMQLLAPLTYVRGDGTRWTARAGLVFDGASIPRVLWRLIGSPFTGEYREAAIIHDQLCADGRAGIAPCDSATAHAVFRDAIRALGGSALRARTMWAAVRTFGPRFKAGRYAE